MTSSIKDPDVSVVLLAYNSLEHTTEPCVTSILSTDAGANYELIIVDNASQDGTRDYLTKIAKRNSNIRLVLNSSNLGFAGGNNAGIKIARGKYIVLLNSDTLVSDNWIKKLVAPMTENPAIGMVGPITNSAGNEQCLNFPEISASNFDTVTKQYCLIKTGSFFQTEKLGFFCVAISKSVIDEIGYLDEDYSVGMFEDDDYSVRVRKANYHLLVIEDCFIFHHGSFSFKKLSSKNTAELFRKNRTVFQKKHAVLWKFADITSAIWSRLKSDIEESFISPDGTAQQLLNPRLQIMTNAIEQVKTNERNFEISKDFDLMQIELDEKHAELMKLSEWATSLKNSNEDLSVQMQGFKNEIHDLKNRLEYLEQKAIVKLLRLLKLV